MKKKHMRVLREIQKSVPKELLAKAVTRGPIAPSIRKVFEESLKMENISEEKKKMIHHMLLSGQLDKVVDNVDNEVTKKIEEYIEKEIEKAIKLGRLPEKDKTILKKIKKLTKKYGKQTFDKRGDEGSSNE